MSAGLWCGLLLTLTTILQPLYPRQNAGGFATDMHRFLPIARRSPTNYVLASALLFGPVVALVGLWREPTQPPFVLTAVGLAAVVAGPLLTSRYLAEPNCEIILSWDPESMPADWRTVRPVLPAELGPGRADLVGLRALPRSGLPPPHLIRRSRS